MDASKSDFSDDKIAILQWILKEPQQVILLSRKSVWGSAVTNGKEFIIEIGPRFVLMIAMFIALLISARIEEKNLKKKLSTLIK